MKKYYVYTHSASGRVFYVGCATANLNKRGTRAKRQRAYSKSGHTKAWHDAAKSGYDVAIVFESDDRAEAFSREIALIAELRDAGEPLVNLSSGGPGIPGVKDPCEVRRKKAVTKVGDLNPMFGKTGAAHPNSRRVLDRASGAVYDSVLLAAQATGHKMKTLYNWLSGHRPNPTTMEFC